MAALRVHARAEAGGGRLTGQLRPGGQAYLEEHSWEGHVASGLARVAPAQWVSASVLQVPMAGVSLRG